ncbi:MAG: hypothetical protein [Wufeng shrew rhabdovirus 8]|nr:MAG: hypothetical protein [Wufeng shrew rhabdovirus 8]
MPRNSRIKPDQSPDVKALSQTETQEMKALAKTCQPSLDKIADIFGADGMIDYIPDQADVIQLPMDEQFDQLADATDRDTQTQVLHSNVRDLRASKRYLDYMETTLDSVQVPKGVKDESLRWSKRYLSTIPEQVLANDNVISLVEHITGRVVDAISKSTLMSTVSTMFNQIGSLMTQVTNLTVAQDHSARLINSMSESLQTIEKHTGEVTMSKENAQLYELYGAAKFYARANDIVIDKQKLWSVINDKASALIALPENKLNTAIKVLCKSVAR